MANEKLITLSNLETFKEKIVALIPTVNNATLTIKRNNTSVGTFTANASEAVSINITVPTGDSDLTNNRYVRYDVGTQSLTDTQKGYARTNIGAVAANELTSSDITTALGFTPYNSTNPNGYTTNTGTITQIKVNGTSIATSGVANITTSDLALKDSDLTNDKYVRFDSNAQGLTSTQKANARTNIGAGTSSFSGSYNDLSNKPTLGTAAACNTGTSSGNVPVLDSNGKLASSVVPAIAITDTFTANSETAMTALTAQVGDVCIRTDVSKTYILAEEGASTASHWKELATPADAVSSVNGQTGAVSVGTVTSVTIAAGTGLAVSNSAAVTTTGTRTISIASGYKLPTTDEWAAKANASAIPDDITDLGVSFATTADINGLFAA